jgi:hypothetical protein
MQSAQSEVMRLAARLGVSECEMIEWGEDAMKASEFIKEMRQLADTDDAQTCGECFLRRYCDKGPLVLCDIVASAADAAGVEVDE